MEAWLVKMMGWLTQLLEPVYFEGDWFDPRMRRQINRECEYEGMFAPFDQKRFDDD
jgi:hypothetical protein